LFAPYRSDAARSAGGERSCSRLVQDPNETENALLKTLGLELGTILLPDAHAPDDSHAAYVDDLAATIRSSLISDDAVCLSLRVGTQGKNGHLSLIWPASALSGISLPSTAARSAPAATQTKEDSNRRGSALPTQDGKGTVHEASRRWPKRSESLSLRGDHLLSRHGPGNRPASPVRAQPPQSHGAGHSHTGINEATAESRPGIESRIDHSVQQACNDTLTLEVGRHTVAVGEAVKVATSSDCGSRQWPCPANVSGSCRKRPPTSGPSKPAGNHGTSWDPSSLNRCRRWPAPLSSRDYSP